MSSSTKRQRIVHLSTADWVRQRPEVFFGAMEPTSVRIVNLTERTVQHIQLCPAIPVLINELVTNAVDNVQRDATQRYIAVKWQEGRLLVQNDGSVVPIEANDDGVFLPTLAFGQFQTGSNFDDLATGTKDVAYTAGRNGVGAKGANLFATRFDVTIVDAAAKRKFTQTWHDGMTKTSSPKITSTALTVNRTVVEWTYDPDKLGVVPDADMTTVVQSLVQNAALCAPPSVRVSFNGDTLKIRTPEQACRALGGGAPFACDQVTHQDGTVVLHLCVAACGNGECRPSSASLTHAFVNSTPCCEGSHAKLILGKVAEIVQQKVKHTRGASNDVRVTPTFVAQHAIVVALLFVERERFTDQRKTCLDTPVRDWGWSWTPSEQFRHALERSGLAAKAIALAHEKEDVDAAKATKSTRARHPIVAKYDPALVLHKGTATLLVTEGDSAKNFATAGLSVVSRKHFGVYPIRGKFLNVRGETSKTILDNKEALELIRILGIQMHVTYTEDMARALPYAKLMVMSDQDVDGSHIAGLLYNLIDVCAPSLLAIRPGFLCRFATSLIRVDVPGEPTIGFYSQSEYDEWCTTRNAERKSLGKASYFKGLGTSSAALAKEYFGRLASHTIVVTHQGPESSEALDMAFNRKRAEDRKRFLIDCDRTAYVDYSLEEVTITEFVTRELLPQYAIASLTRAIPAIDGLKEALRKVLFGARDLRLPPQGTSVANAAGKIASHTHYHHRGTAMEDAIVGMAADYAGCGNANLLLPLGQFGTRHRHAAASAAYPKTALHPLHALLYPPVDDAVLERVVDEGVAVEPTLYAPVVATPLVFGCRGIATGWSTDIPPFHPLDVLAATRAFVTGTDPPPLKPWFRGFRGEIEMLDDGSVLLRGISEWHGDDLHILELPPLRETEAHREEWVKADLASGGIVAGDNHTDETVHYILRGCRRDVTPRDLGLERRIVLTNMHLLNASGRLQKYATPYDIVVDHGAMRRSVYDRRRQHEIEGCVRAAQRARSVAHFVSLILNGTLQLNDYDGDEDVGTACASLGVPAVEGSYAHLLALPMRSLTASRVAKANAEVARLEAEEASLRNTTSDQLWMRDLDALEAFWKNDARLAV